MNKFYLTVILLALGCGSDPFIGGNNVPPPEKCLSGELADTWKQVGGVHDGSKINFQENCTGHDDACGLVFTYQVGSALHFHVIEVSGDPECLVTNPGDYNCDIDLDGEDLTLECGNGEFTYKVDKNGSH